VTLDELNARAILDATHAAWSCSDVEAMLRHFDDDAVYWCNAGGPRPRPLTIVGKPMLRYFLESVSSVAESMCVSDYFRLIGGVGRARIEGFVRHKETGLTLVGTYRQVVTFRDRKIVRLDEYHDAAKMVTFWRHIVGEAKAEVISGQQNEQGSRPDPRVEGIDIAHSQAVFARAPRS